MSLETVFKPAHNNALITHRTNGSNIDPRCRLMIPLYGVVHAQQPLITWLCKSRITPTRTNFWIPSLVFHVLMAKNQLHKENTTLWIWESHPGTFEKLPNHLSCMHKSNVLLRILPTYVLACFHKKIETKSTQEKGSLHFCIYVPSTHIHLPPTIKEARPLKTFKTFVQTW